ncbi:MAG TPA: hypothetical protein VGD08_19725 [Stellaceae bacterium]
MCENDIGALPTSLPLKQPAAELLAEAVATAQAEASDALVQLARTLLAHASRLETDGAEPAGADPRPKPSE